MHLRNVERVGANRIEILLARFMAEPVDLASGLSRV
jgi:hypothetical protein